MNPDRIPQLTDLAFEGRNKEYGAYMLRKKYSRYLLISVLAGILVLLAVSLGPFAIYYFEPVELVEMDMIYDVEYDVMMAPQDEDPNRLAARIARPLKEAELQPIVTDSVNPEKVIPVREIEPPDEPEPDPATADTAGGGKGKQGTGLTGGEETGLATTIDVYPRYPGGEDSRLFFLRKNIRYPDAAIKKGIQGIVMVIITLESDGAVSKVEISQAIGGGCDEEAVRVVKLMPRWEPGKRKGRPVKVMVRMPIVFRIPGKA
jgi:protein TonB